MKKVLLFFLLLFSSFAFSQKEASVWYFGDHAGLKFNDDNTVTQIYGSQLKTLEGCASIADSDGNLLFYTDGRTVWDRNHVAMPNGSYANGTQLFGDPSSTQSAIIVPKPNNANIYYIFTVDEPHVANANSYPNAFSGTYFDTSQTPQDDDGRNNGLNYSIVDLSVVGSNGSIGDIVSRNNQLVTYDPNPTGIEIKYKCSEKITAVKNNTNNSYWVITQFIDKFYSFKIDVSGINTTAIISTVPPLVTLGGYRYNAQGCLKASPDGTKLAMATAQNTPIFVDEDMYSGSVYLYDFNLSTGFVSNPINLISNERCYGVEFSKNSNLLYVNYLSNNYVPLLFTYRIAQFDLSSSSIPNSSVIIGTTSTFSLGSLQLGIDNKIYICKSGHPYLHVINNPDVVGTGCNFVFDQLELLNGAKALSGLPPFITSYFNVAFTAQHLCFGETSSFILNSSQPPTSVTWNFGDGSTSTAISPTHTYTAAGNYTVTTTVVNGAGTATNTMQITIYSLPTLLSSTITLKQCDDNLDGFSNFNLNETIPLLVANSAGLTFTFHETLADAQNKTGAITNLTAYANQVVSNDIIYARVENANGCYSTAQINLRVSTTLIPAGFMITKNECDDTASGSNTDGIATFDFSTADAQIRALYPAGQLLTVSYYKNLADALAETNAITNTSSYTNTGYPNTQNIYVRVDSQINNECLGLGHHITLKVDRIPIVQPQTIRQCDDNQDGVFSFNTTTLQSDLLNGLNNVVVTYTNQAGTPVVMTNPFSTTSQKLNVNVKNNFGKQCDYTSTVEFIVDDLPEAFSIPITDTTKCDDEVYPALQNGTYPFDTSSFQATILGSQTGMQVNYYDANNVALTSPLPNPFLTGTQTIRAEVVNTTNTTCKATVTIPFVVKPSPEINPTGSELVCSNNTSFTKTIDAGLLNPTLQNNFTYKWYKDGVLLPMATAYSLVINAPGTYTVSVEGSNGCPKTRTITAVASDIAIIDSIVVNDLTEDNSILILVSSSSLGDYVYSIDNQTYQESNFFNNLLPGIHTVYVKDKNGCGITNQEVSVLGIPPYFTPNGDGYNDYWNIKGFNRSKNTSTKIRIYDRYGKLIKQISPISLGWDGTYNGNQLPSEDYWYSIELEDGRILKGHFALKR